MHSDGQLMLVTSIIEFPKSLNSTQILFVLQRFVQKSISNSEKQQYSDFHTEAVRL